MNNNTLGAISLSSPSAISLLKEGLAMKGVEEIYGIISPDKGKIVTILGHCWHFPSHHSPKALDQRKSICKR